MPSEVTAEEIAAMLQKIPPRPDYGTWIKIASAVWSVLPLGEGARLLNQWSPEEREGEYASKHRARLKQIGIGTLVMLAKQHGWQGSIKGHGARRVLIRTAPTPTSRNTRPGWLSQAAQPTAEDVEAARIAAELKKLHAAGALTGADDPHAPMLAAAIHLFKGTVLTAPTPTTTHQATLL